jgi:hypothetical protein
MSTGSTYAVDTGSVVVRDVTSPRQVKGLTVTYVSSPLFFFEINFTVDLKQTGPAFAARGNEVN